MTQFYPLFSWIAGSLFGMVLGVAFMAWFKYATGGAELTYVSFVVGGLVGFSTLVPAYLMFGDTRGIGSGITAAVASIFALYIGRVIGVAMISTPEEFSLISAMFEMPGPWDGMNIVFAIMVAFPVASGLQFD
ncbi:MAG: hypothetical protein KDA65_10815 [Planctomycetaceae bacterium]|nr:hypothetical protein [Planctomycetaceae bacterium]